MNYQEIIAVVAILIGFVSYGYYFYGIFYGRTKPHAFSWFIWGIINGIAFLAQFIKGGGAGAWVTAANGTLCFVVFSLALWKGEKNITRSDWYCLFGALAGVVGWVATKNPLTAVILISITDVFAVTPTIRKSYHKPFEENVFSFSVDLVKFCLELFALASFNLTTALFPITILINDSVLVAVILVRRHQLKARQIFSS